MIPSQSNVTVSKDRTMFELWAMKKGKPYLVSAIDVFFAENPLIYQTWAYETWQLLLHTPDLEPMPETKEAFEV